MAIVTIKEGNILPLSDDIVKTLNLKIGHILEWKLSENKTVILEKVNREISKEEFDSNEMLVKVEKT